MVFGAGGDLGNCSGSAEGVALVKVSAAEEVTAGSADELATAVFEAGRAGGAESGVMLGGDGGLFDHDAWCGCFGDQGGLHQAILAQMCTIFKSDGGAHGIE